MTSVLEINYSDTKFTTLSMATENVKKFNFCDQLIINYSFHQEKLLSNSIDCMKYLLILGHEVDIVDFLMCIVSPKCSSFLNFHKCIYFLQLISSNSYSCKYSIYDTKA